SSRARTPPKYLVTPSHSTSGAPGATVPGRGVALLGTAGAGACSAGGGTTSFSRVPGVSAVVASSASGAGAWAVAFAPGSAPASGEVAAVGEPSSVAGAVP